MIPAFAPADDLALAERALHDYELPDGATLDFVRHGENTIFRVDADDASFALRVHRPRYQTVDSLRSEMAWTESLAATGLIVAAPPLVGRDGEIVRRFTAEDGTERLVTALRWMPGRPLASIDRLSMWHRLGELMATVHRHGRDWQRPAWFTRRTWDVEGLVGERPLWGDPLRLGDWDDEGAGLIEACQEAVRRHLTAASRDRDHFGLIHADLSFENVLVQDDGTTVLIDFDDGGFGWFLYDMAVSLFPFEDRPGFADRRDALVAGYRSVLPLDDEDLAELPTFLMARRLATLGWIFTHADTDHARRQRGHRLECFPAAADRFLDWVAYRDELASPVGAGSESARH